MTGAVGGSGEGWLAGEGGGAPGRWRVGAAAAGFLLLGEALGGERGLRGGAPGGQPKVGSTAAGEVARAARGRAAAERSKGGNGAAGGWALYIA